MTITTITGGVGAIIIIGVGRLSNGFITMALKTAGTGVTFTGAGVEGVMDIEEGVIISINNTTIAGTINKTITITGIWEKLAGTSTIDDLTFIELVFHLFLGPMG